MKQFMKVTKPFWIAGANVPKLFAANDVS